MDLSLLLTHLRHRLGRDEEGATMVEYGLLIALVAVALIVTIGLLTDGLDGIFGDAATALEGAGEG